MNQSLGVFLGLIMIVVQAILLKVALDYRSHNDGGVPFTGLVQHPKRPYNFWQWRSQRPYVPDISVLSARQQYC